MRKVRSIEKAKGNDIVYPNFPAKINREINILLGDRNEPANPQLIQILKKYVEIYKLLINSKKLEELTNIAISYYKCAIKLAGKTFDVSNAPDKIQITIFGTGGSFTYSEWSMYTGVYKIICLRADFSKDRVLYLLIRSILGEDLALAGFTMNQQAEIATYFTNKLLESEVSKFYPYFDSPIFTADNFSKFKRQKFTGKLIYLNDFFKKYKLKKYEKGEDKILNKNELKVLQLIRQTRGVCSYDRIAEILWQDNWQENFSLEAIYKLISRIKVKISYIGINPDSIISIPNQGYIFQK